MQNIKEYISIMIYISIVLVILELITPETKLKKFVISIISLFTVILIINPLTNIIKNNDFKDVTSKIIETLSNKYEEASYTYKGSNILNNKNKKINESVKTNLEKELKGYLERKYNQVIISEVVCKLDKNYKLEDINITILKKENVNIDKEKLSFVSDIIDDLETKYEIPKETFTIIMED